MSLVKRLERSSSELSAWAKSVLPDPLRLVQDAHDLAPLTEEPMVPAGLLPRIDRAAWILMVWADRPLLPPGSPVPLGLRWLGAVRGANRPMLSAVTDLVEHLGDSESRLHAGVAYQLVLAEQYATVVSRHTAHEATDWARNQLPIDVQLRAVHPATLDAVQRRARRLRDVLRFGAHDGVRPEGAGSPAFEASACDLLDPSGDARIVRTARGERVRRQELHAALLRPLLDVDDRLGIRTLTWYDPYRGTLSRTRSLEEVVERCSAGRSSVGSLRAELTTLCPHGPTEPHLLLSGLERTWARSEPGR